MIPSHIFFLCLGQMNAHRQNVTNCQNTLTKLTLMGVIGWGREYLMPPPHHVLGWKNKISYFNIYLRFTVIFTGLIRTTCSHSLPIFNILSMYSIRRMRGNRNQSHNELHFSKHSGREFPRPRPPPPLRVASCLRRRC